MIQAGDDDAERFSQLVDVLLDSELPFKEASLGNGEWQVRLSLQVWYVLYLTDPVHTYSTAFVVHAAVTSSNALSQRQNDL